MLPALFSITKVIIQCPYRLSEVLRGDVQATLQWLRSLQSLESEQVYLYVSALMVSHCEKEVRLASLQVLVASFATCPAAAHSLTLLLYQLAREKDPEIQLALLRALPTTAVDKVNISNQYSEKDNFINHCIQ